MDQLIVELECLLLFSQLAVRVCDQKHHARSRLVSEGVGAFRVRIENLREFVSFVLQLHLFQLGDLFPFAFGVQRDGSFEELVGLILLLEIGSENSGACQRLGLDCRFGSIGSKLAEKVECLLLLIVLEREVGQGQTRCIAVRILAGEFATTSCMRRPLPPSCRSIPGTSLDNIVRLV